RGCRPLRPGRDRHLHALRGHACRPTRGGTGGDDAGLPSGEGTQGPSLAVRPTHDGPLGGVPARTVPARTDHGAVPGLGGGTSTHDGPAGGPTVLRVGDAVGGVRRDRRRTDHYGTEGRRT